MNAMKRKVKLFKNNTTKYFLSLINCMKVRVIIYISGKANLIKLKNIISRFWLAGKISNLHSQNRVALTKYSLDTFYGKCTCDCWLMFKTKTKKKRKFCIYLFRIFVYYKKNWLKCQKQNEHNKVFCVLNENRNQINVWN